MMTDRAPPDDGLVDEWDAAMEARTVRARVFETASTLTEPTSVATVAERADCTVEGVRPHLEWFVELGVLEKVTDAPARYVRNDAYFEFRRITELVRQVEDATAIQEAIETYRDRDDRLQAAFGVAAPELVVLGDVDDGRLDDTVDRLHEWRTVRRRLRELHEAKRRLDSGPARSP
jgi:hypothetical protein